MTLLAAPDRSLLVLRVHAGQSADVPRLLAFAQAVGHEACFACDERRGPIPVDGAAKAVVGDLLARGVLHEATPFDPYWLCGDYALYAAYLLRPGYRHYWLIEPDVAFVFDDPAVVFARLHGQVPHDMVGVRVGPAPPDWGWRSAATPTLGDDLYRCFFPVLRLSNRAVAYLFARRIALSARLRAREPAERAALDWPNDEAFVATEVVRGGFTWIDLDTVLPGSCTEDTCAFRRFFLRPEVTARGERGRIYHSVLDGELFLAKVLAQAPDQYPPHELVRLIETHTGTAWSAEAAAPYLAHLRGRGSVTITP